jgi:hypothetical protein
LSQIGQERKCDCVNKVEDRPPGACDAAGENVWWEVVNLGGTIQHEAPVLNARYHVIDAFGSLCSGQMPTSTRAQQKAISYVGWREQKNKHWILENSKIIVHNFLG